MASTIIPRGSALAVKKFGVALTIAQPRRSYWNKFFGQGEETEQPVMELLGLESDQGDKMDYQLVGAPSTGPTEGDAPQAGREEPIIENTCEIGIDALTHGTDCGRKMTRKRSKHDLRKIVKASEGPYWARVIDELCFMYASGARGDNAQFLFPTGYTGFAGNTITAPDSGHKKIQAGAYSSSGTSYVTTLASLNTVKTIIDMLGVDVNGVPEMQPTNVDGTECYIYLMSKYAENDLKSASSGNTWLDIQKALLTAVGKDGDILKGAMGFYDGMILHSHQKVIRFAVGTSIGGVAITTNPISRNLVLGRQALTCAWGVKGNKGVRYGWNEFYDDHGRKLVIDTDTCVGITKNIYAAVDYGVFCHDVSYVTV
jgi:N4-gp56 family major capsid protein